LINSAPLAVNHPKTCEAVDEERRPRVVFDVFLGSMSKRRRRHEKEET